MTIPGTNFAEKTFARRQLSSFSCEKTFANGNIQEKKTVISLYKRSLYLTKKSISMTSIQSSDCKTQPKVIVVNDEW